MPRKALTKRQQRIERQRQWLKQVGADAWVSAVRRSPIPFEVWQHHHPELGFQSLLETPCVLVLYHVPGIGWRCIDSRLTVGMMLALLRMAGRKAVLSTTADYLQPEVLAMLDWIHKASTLRLVCTARGNRLASGQSLSVDD
ncbi:MAG TPA: hypothetical protein PLD20_17945 [Blastocatellia bacterium]|nr:hypothetical protein [Blastocatellia bacterium]HMX26661.1 hypothetical protein [Blastocatellia bacterium]HMY75434.1 hypothetical protein [Blastocatellia bacterium]HMZ19823.1 hypothetical protein [Blastocatellia bacterium]